MAVQRLQPVLGLQTEPDLVSGVVQRVRVGVWAELARLNHEYEDRFGFRFVVFVNRRPKSEIVPVLRERLTRSRDEELDTAVQELVAIAEDRWRRS